MPVLEPNAETASLPGLHLYHFAASSCSQRVRLGLAEKGLAYKSHIVNLSAGEHLRPEFVAINPLGLVPAMVFDGQRIVESLDILHFLERRFPEPALRGPDVSRSQRLLDLADDAQEHIRVLTQEYVARARGPIGPELVERRVAATRTPEEAALFLSFVNADESWERRLRFAISGMSEVLGHVEHALTEAPFLEGASYGLADLAWLPGFHRLKQIAWPLERWAAILAWYERGVARPNFHEAIGQFEIEVQEKALADYQLQRAAQGTSVTHYLDSHS